jgi:type IV secretion system protein VirB9
MCKILIGRLQIKKLLIFHKKMLHFSNYYRGLFRMRNLVLIAALSLSTALASDQDGRGGGLAVEVLSQQEKLGLGITREWEKRSTEAIHPTPGPNGAVQFSFGTSLPTIVCAIFQITDVQLEPGEIVTDINLGDSARWYAESAMSGIGGEESNKVEHIIIKPKDIGLKTTLLITTNRRTYHLILKSQRDEYMHAVSFTYPPLAKKTIAKKTEETGGEKKSGGDKEVLEVPVGQYIVKGKASWKPVSVYSDGKKTYIEMSPNIHQTEAPTLYTLRHNGLFTAAEKVLVNYRVHDKWYVVDTVIDKAILVAGVGGNQDKVTITRKN